MEHNRAWSILNIKSFVEAERTLEGLATTPSTDRMGDVVESTGAKYKLPMPLLWQHRSSEPVGWVEEAIAGDGGITIKARFAKIAEPGELKDICDKAWQAVSNKLVRALSIGFLPLEVEPIKDSKNYGLRIKTWEWLETSLVTIPANADATITMVRTLDEAFLNLNGKERGGVKTTRQPIKLKESSTMPKTIRERINEAEAAIAAKAVQMQAIMDAADEKNETLDAEADDKFATLKSEIDGVEKHLGRLREMERINVARARPVNGDTADVAAASRGAGNGGHMPPIVVRQREVEPWVGFVRMTIAKLAAYASGNAITAHEYASGRADWMATTPEVAIAVRAPVNAATTTDPVWAGPLVQYQNFSQAFAEYLRPLTIIGRINGMRRVPFKIRIPRMTAGATVNWVGEGKAKPLSALAFDTITMDFAKIAGIIPLTEEVVRFSDPAIEPIVRQELADAIVQFMDAQFVDPSKTANDVSPASITNGATSITPSGTTAAALRSDVNRLMQGFLQNNLSMASAVWIMTQTLAMRLGNLVNTLGQPEFPGISAAGGALFGVPVVASENIPSTTGSPAEGWPLILAKADEILLADDGQVTIDASREASLQMESAPDSPPTASTVLTSLWQHNMIAIKAERFINWRLRRSNAVAYIAGAVYTG